MSLTSSTKTDISTIGRDKTFPSNSSLQKLEGQAAIEERRGKWFVLEVAVIAFILLIILALSSLPILFFYKPVVKKK